MEEPPPPARQPRRSHEEKASSGRLCSGGGGWEGVCRDGRGGLGRSVCSLQGSAGSTEMRERCTGRGS